jgi:hypothetical protein
MNRIKEVFIFLILPLLVFACASTREIQQPPQFSFEDPVLSKGLYHKGTSGIPVDRTTTFSPDDPEVIASLKLKNLSGRHTLRWDWYDPSGNLYSSTGNYPLETSKGKYLREATAWHKLSIQGESTAHYPGAWKVNIYLDKQFITSKAFEIRPEHLLPIKPGLAKRKSFAVVVGVSKYLHASKGGLTDLPFADDDAQAFRDTLLALGWDSDHIRCLIDKGATQRDITISLESWLTKAGPDDLIVLFWAGHGFPDPEDPEKVYFACYDTDPVIPATGYRMDRVRQILEERSAKNVVILADTCHAGKLITRGVKAISVNPYIERLKRERRVPKGWIFMVGADTDRQAIEHSSWSNGAFTHCLLGALSGLADGYESAGPKDGVVTMGELRAYMESAMPDETQRVLGVAKRPVITTSTGDPDIWNLSLHMK